MNKTLTLVPAGAGSGKTYRIKTVLTDWIRTGAVKPERILAVTFTEAAAAELRGRIRESLLESGLVEAAIALERAYVGTIHSLGLRLLKEHAFAAGLTPAPRQLQPSEEALLLRQAMVDCDALKPVAEAPERFFYGSWNEGAEVGLRDNVLGMIQLLRGLGETGLRADLAEAACARIDRLWGHVMEDPRPSRDRLQDAVTTLLEAYPRGALRDGLNKKAEDDFRRNLRSMRAATDASRLDWDWATWQSLRKLRKSTGGCPTPDGYDALADEVMLSAEAILTHPGPRETAKTNLRALVLGAQEIMQRYAARKRAFGVMDFTDMIVETEAMLRSRPDVLKAVQDEVDCVIIDEFQDTNPVQFALLWRLAEHAPRTLLVGDVKQSIMGFQGADPRLSKALEEEYQHAVEPLRQNRRSDPRIMDLVNAIGSGLFGDGYQSLTAHRGMTGEPALEVLRLSRGRKGNSPIPKPPAQIAARIADMLAAGELVTDRKTEQKRPVQPSDIAVLCYRHDEAARYAEALRALGMPVRISASGWLDAQAVLVARYALAFMADPSDSHAGLVYLSFGPTCLPPDKSLALLTSGGLLDNAGLAPLRALADRATGSSVTERVAQVCRYLRDWAEALPEPSQALADLAKLEALAADFDAAEPGMHEAAGLHGRGTKVFLAWLETQRAAREFDRHPDPGADAAPGIEVVTWHSSKGREWPVTVVCELDKDIYEWPNTTRAVFSDFSDLTNILDKATLEHTPNCPVPELQHRMAQDRQAAAEDEAHNLIYVVLTRARDRLVIEWIGGALDRDPITCLGLLARDARMSVDATGLHAMDQNFAATVYDNPAGNGRDPIASPAPPYRRFGTISPPALYVSDVPFRRRPSAETKVAPLPNALHTIDLGTAQTASSDASATERGTAWHLAFRALSARRDLVHSVSAATGLSEQVLAAIAGQADAIRRWADKQGCPALLFEQPVHVTHPDGSETLGTIDLIARGQDSLWIIDHKTGKATGPEERFLSYWPQLSAYAEAAHLAFGQKVTGVAIHWMEEGKLSVLRL